MEEEDLTEYVYAAVPQAPSIWSYVFQSILIASTSIFTATVLLGLLALALVYNGKKIMDQLMGFYLAIILRQIGEIADDRENASLDDEEDCSPFFKRQDTPAPFAGRPLIR